MYFFCFYYHFALNVKCNKVIEGEKTLIYFEVHDEISSRESFVNYVICLMCQYRCGTIAGMSFNLSLSLFSHVQLNGT